MWAIRRVSMRPLHRRPFLRFFPTLLFPPFVHVGSMMRFDARVDVMKALKEKGLYRGEADNEMGMHNRPVAFSFILLAHFGLLPAVASLIISV